MAHELGFKLVTKAELFGESLSPTDEDDKNFYLVVLEKSNPIKNRCGGIYRTFPDFWKWTVGALNLFRTYDFKEITVWSSKQISFVLLFSLLFILFCQIVRFVVVFWIWMDIVVGIGTLRQSFSEFDNRIREVFRKSLA